MTWPNLTFLPMLASAYLLTQNPLMSETETNKTNERRRLKWGQGDYKEEEEENFVICDPIWCKSSGSRSDTLRKVTSCSRAVRGISGYKENVTSKFTLKVIKFFNQNFNVPAPGLFYVYFCSFQRQFYWNIVDFSCIRTRIVGDEGDLVDQLTNTTANQSIFCVQIAVERLWFTLVALKYLAIALD